MDAKDRRIAELEEEVRHLQERLDESELIRIRKKKPMRSTSAARSIHSIAEKERQRSWDGSFRGIRLSVGLVCLGLMPFLVIPAVGWLRENWHLIEHRLLGL